jgi:hypothetical protein
LGRLLNVAGDLLLRVAVRCSSTAEAMVEEISDIRPITHRLLGGRLNALI